MMRTHHPLAGLEMTGREMDLLSIRPAADGARFILRISPQDLAVASSVWGAGLPETIGGLTSSPGRTAVCLGPDEWFLLAPLAEQESIEQAFAGIYATTIHSLVDIGHREVGIEVQGRDAVLALQSVIAFDIGAMQVPGGCRTVLDKTQVILLREAADRFRIEVWNSFSDHVWHLLHGIYRELEVGA
jgi:sarcosine oxidase subunit gamma